MWALSSCSKWMPLSSWDPPASHCSGFSRCRAGSRCVDFSSCGTWAQLPRGIWNLPRPGIKPMPPALAGRFLPTTPPGKSCASFSLVFCQSSTNYVCISKQYVHYISMFGNFFLQWNYASMYHCVTCSLRLSFFAVSAVFNYFSLLFCIVFDYI